MARVAIETICNLLLRFLALATTVSAAVVMATSKEDTRYFFFRLRADYRKTPSFTYFFIAYVIGAGYSLLSMLVPARSLFHRFVLVLDLVITMLLTSSMSAAIAVAYIGKEGNSYAGWRPICDQVEDFCEHVLIALAMGFASVVIYGLIVLLSVYLAVSFSFQNRSPYRN